MDGYLCLVLSAHVPYLRAAGRWPHGEDALHETIALSLVPTLNVLCDLRERGMQPRVALAYSPLLLEQLSDRVIQKHMVLWLDAWLARASEAHERWQRQGDGHNIYLAQFYLDWAHGIHESFTRRYRRDLVTVLRELCAAGIVEPLAGAASHAYLPLLASERAIRAQLRLGARAVKRHLGHQPRGLWLPECGYSERLLPLLLASETRYLVIDPASIVNAEAYDPRRPLTVMPRRLTAFARDQQLATDVYSSELGYPGDPLYRADGRDDASGLALWCNGPGAGSHPYDPYHAFRRTREHARHFLARAAELLQPAPTDSPGVLVVPLDADVLGRRWFEGPAWLRAVLEELAEAGKPQLTTPSAYLRAYPAGQPALLRDGSWGEGGDHRAWASSAASALWGALHEAEERLATLVGTVAIGERSRARVLNQAVRELLLAQSSDWPLLLGQGIAPGAALARPSEHLHRCEWLCSIVERGNQRLSSAEQQKLSEIEERDNAFSWLQAGVFS